MHLFTQPCRITHWVGLVHILHKVFDGGILHNPTQTIIDPSFKCIHFSFHMEVQIILCQTWEVKNPAQSGMPADKENEMSMKINA